MMHDKFRKARQDHLCAGCEKNIEKGTQYYHRHPNNYHNECLPKAEPTPVAETKIEPVSLGGTQYNPPEVKTDPKTKPARDAKGHFIKKEGR